MNEQVAVTLLTDKDWQTIEEEFCLVSEFAAMAKMEGRKVRAASASTPYATVRLQCPKFAGEATGFITQKVDFAMLWSAFSERSEVVGAHTEVRAEDIQISPRGLGPGEEVCLIWTRRRYRKGLGLLRGGLPRLIVMVCPKGAYQLATKREVRPELSGVARFRAEAPLVTWTPEAMER